MDNDFIKSFSNAFDWEYKLRSEKELKERFDNINFDVLLEGLISSLTPQNILQNITINDFVTLTLLSKYSTFWSKYTEKKVNLEELKQQASTFIEKQQEELKESKDEKFLEIIDNYDKRGDYRTFYYIIDNIGLKGTIDFWWRNDYSGDNLILSVDFDGLDDFSKKIEIIDNSSHSTTGWSIRNDIDGLMELEYLNKDTKIKKLSRDNNKYFLNNLKKLIK